ncbi:MAG: three-Cys-motif partner protein TcmP [Anaerolineae bacterium]
MADNSFFDESRQPSQVKAAIVAKYFDAWSRVMIGAQKKGQTDSPGKFAYIDLFAGPGRYKDGTRSTPLLVLEKAIADPDLRQMLVTIFNDKDEDCTRSLQEAIEALPGIETLSYAPQVSCHEVGEDIVRQFEQMRLVPTLFFVDPWGYRGLSLRLVNSVLKNWGCDCILFFNYNRINMGLSNPVVWSHMDALFGQQRADALRQRLEPMTPEVRQLEIVQAICDALEEMGGRFTLPFRFTDDKGTRTSHHLIFVSKHFRGYGIMKDIMAGESSAAAQGVASFGYSPADRRQPLLFELARPLDDLEGMLLADLAGRTLSVKAIYETHSVGRPYVRKNYNAVLRALESAGKVTATAHRKGSLGDDVQVTFPSRKG